MKEKLSVIPATDFVAYKAPILSVTQIEMVALLLNGESPASVCRKLNIAEYTYRSYLYKGPYSIFRKYEWHYGGRPLSTTNLISRILIAEPNVQEPLDGSFTLTQIDLPYPAQYDILTLLPFGYSDKEIAYQINYSPNHISQLISGRKSTQEALFDWFERMYAVPIFTRTQLVIQSIQRGIVQYMPAGNEK